MNLEWQRAFKSFSTEKILSNQSTVRQVKQKVEFHPRKKGCYLWFKAVGQLWMWHRYQMNIKTQVIYVLTRAQLEDFFICKPGFFVLSSTFLRSKSSFDTGVFKSHQRLCLILKENDLSSKVNIVASSSYVDPTLFMST